MAFVKIAVNNPESTVIIFFNNAMQLVAFIKKE